MTHWQPGDHVHITTWLTHPTGRVLGLNRAPARILKVGHRTAVRGLTTIYTVRLDPTGETVTQLPLYLADTDGLLVEAGDHQLTLF